MLRAKSILAASTLQLPFLLLFLTSVSPYCHVRTADECNEEKEFVPGYNLAGGGFDITTLKKKSQVLDLSRWRKADGTCTMCSNPFLQDKPLQRLPLVVVDWTAKVSCQRNVHSSLETSGIDTVHNAASDVKNDWKVGLDVQPKPGQQVQMEFAGTHSALADFTMAKNNKDKYNFARHEVSCSYYSFRISQYIPSNHFKHSLRNLPAKYRPNSLLEYQQLIDTYGTHFINHLHLGGRVRDVTALSVCETALDGTSADEINDCLKLEASANIGEGKGSLSASYNACEELKKKKSFKGSFRETYKERHTDVVGGYQHTDLLFSNNQNSEHYKQWEESLKSMPALLSYSLKPIHDLLPKGDPKRDSLQQAVSDYINKRALWRNCTQPCPPGSQRSVRDPCSCICPNDGATNTMCCSRKRGQSKLKVMIRRAYGLWGDYFTSTDAYVKVSFHGINSQTSTVWNNNNPVWMSHLDLGRVQSMGETSKLRIQVWDEDNRYDDDLLGTCDRTPTSGKPHIEACYLNHGHLEFQYHLECGPFLGGPYCMDYVPQQPHKAALLQRGAK
ncbi:perforin-1-like [Notechis scutatus]|uniref:Perforin-1-like n=1 Tax=Notechis scutatus TaxID=8663 RepID=A0A6J1VFC8_9SAUR|nr:perforin-1-like [Notechis scutatus]XP_026539273.1 perforin-1-like [Notechis scutatus]